MKIGDYTTLSFPFTFSVSSLDTFEPICFAATSLGYQEEIVSNIEPGTYEINLQVQRTDTDIQVTSGFATINVISIPSEVSATCDLGIDLLALSGATSFCVEYDITGTVTTSGYFAFTLEEAQFLLDHQ